MKDIQLANEKIMFDYLSDLLDDSQRHKLNSSATDNAQPVEQNAQNTAETGDPNTAGHQDGNNTATNAAAKAPSKVAPLQSNPLDTEKAISLAVDEPVKTLEVPLTPTIDPAIRSQIERSHELLNEAHNKQPEIKAVMQRQAPESEFQALFFEVAGLTMAVPLTQLGGIHNLSDRNQLLGKPDWFDGVMLHRDEKFKVVDTARWVMPEKYTQVQQELNYQYLILLEDSGWGVMCERLINTEALAPEDVKWITDKRKRPWLAGLVKQKKCALIDVNEMVELMNQGLNCQG